MLVRQTSAKGFVFASQTNADLAKEVCIFDHDSAFLSDAQKRQERKTDYAQAGATFDFLHEDRIKDAKGRRKGEEGWDPRTLHIPTSAYNKFTPFEKQFWDIKRNRM